MTDEPSLQLLIANWELFRDPILVGAVAGAVLGYLGVFIVLRRMIFFAAALSQSAGCGVALAFYAQIHLGFLAGTADPRLWALGLTIAVAWLLNAQAVQALLSREGFLALAYLLGSGGAMLIGTRISQEAHDIQSILFGTGVLVSSADFRWVLSAGAAVLAWQLWWRRGFLFASLDPEGARIRGLPVGWLDAALTFMIAAFVSIATHAIGALPVFAFSVLPALAAILLTKSPGASLALAALFGLLCGVGGYLLAFFEQFPVGASQAFVATAIVLLALAIRGLRAVSMRAA